MKYLLTIIFISLFTFASFGQDSDVIPPPAPKKEYKKCCENPPMSPSKVKRKIKKRTRRNFKK